MTRTAQRGQKNTKTGFKKATCVKETVFSGFDRFGVFFGQSCKKLKGIPFVWYLVSYLATNTKEDCLFRLLHYKLRP